MNAVALVSTVSVRREIAAPAAELFDAWLDPGKLAAWMRPFDTERADVKLDARVGGEFEIVMHTPTGSVPNSPFAGDHGSLVTVDFNARGRSTEIVITHERLPSEEMVQAHAGGWNGILDRIGEAYAETRATG